MDKKSIFGLNENIAAALAYSLFFFSGIVVLIMEKENKFVRFHALQSTLWFMILGVFSTLAGWLPFIGGLIASGIGLVMMISWIVLMFQAIQGKTFKLPIVGDVVEAQIYR